SLLQLVQAARRTRFGLEHDFARIRSVRDYQQRVPLRTYEAFWQQYWQPSFPRLAGVTWPGPIPYLALSSGTTSGTTKYIPVSRPLLASNQRAARTALALFLNAYPSTSLFTGQLFFLGGSTGLRPVADGVLGRQNREPASPGPLAGDLSGIVVH